MTWLGCPGLGSLRRLHSVGSWGHLEDFLSQASGVRLRRNEPPGDGIVETSHVSPSFWGLST